MNELDLKFILETLIECMQYVKTTHIPDAIFVRMIDNLTLSKKILSEIKEGE